MKKITILLALLFYLGLQVANAQEKVVTGKVTSAKEGYALPGVTVVVKGTQIGVSTDKNGMYKISVPEKYNVLKFSFVGMATIEKVIGTNTQIDVAMAEDVLRLDEVVVTALGISREKKALGYSVQELSGEELSKAPEVNLVNSLSGKIAGVQITSASGAIGSSSRIVIRGNSSFSENQPLFVIDGVPVSNYSTGVSQWGDVDFGNAAMDIDPADIASMSVLKGANAAALYGSRAANGVILITTKKAKKGLVAKKGIGVSYTTSVTFDDVYILPNYQNDYGQGYLGSEYYYEIYKDSAQSYEDYGTANSFEFYNGNWSGTMDGIDESWGTRLDIGQKVKQFDSPLEDANDPTTRTATPWVSQPDNVKNFFETGVTFKNHLALSGASEKASARLSITNTDATGAIPNTDLTKNNITFNGSMNLTNKLSAGAQVAYVQNKSDNLPGGGYDANNIMQSIGSWFGRQVNMQSLKENWDTENVFGNPYNWNTSYHNNPYWTVYNNTTSRQRDRVFGNFNINYQLADWLSVMARVGSDFYTETRKHVVANKSNESPNGSFWINNRFEQETNADLIFTATKDFSEDISFNGTFGANYRDYNYNFTSMSASELTVPNFFDIGNAKGSPVTNMYKEQFRTNSVFGSGSFGYKDYLYLDITARNEWSSTLPADNWSYFYPSASLSFILSEALEMNSDVFSFAKLRGSWANVGNHTNPYQLALTYSASTSAFMGTSQYFAPTSMPNSGLLPENINSTEFGGEFRFFKDRIGIDATYYDKVTKNQIMAIDVSTATGFSNMWINAGEIENKGIELLLTGKVLKSEDGFNWNMILNFAKDDAMVNELYGDLEAYQLSNSWGGLTIEARPEEKFGVIKGKGYLRTDTDGDGIQDPDGDLIVSDRGRPLKTATPIEIGNVVPDFTGGFRNAFSYKNLSFSFLIDFRKGGDLYSVTDWFGAYAGITAETAQMASREGVTDKNIREVGLIVGEDVLKNETVVTEDPNNPGTYIKNDIVTSAQGYYENYWGNQEASIIDGSFIKLREIVFSYQLPKEWLDGIFIQSANLSFVGRNVALLWVHESNDIHIDPETGFGTGLSGMGLEQYQLPPTRSLGFRLNVNF